MTIDEAWAVGRDLLAQASFSPVLDARLLLEHVLQVGHSYLIAHGDERISKQQEQVYRSLLIRAEQREPIPYIIGKTTFYGLEFDVNPAVLIPRPETEQLVEEALKWLGRRKNIRAVDVGTGSGCIAVALAQVVPPANITAVDISNAALAAAKQNAAKHGLQDISFVQGDLLRSLDGPFDLIVANLPYVADDEWTLVDESVKLYEPRLALSGGERGLELIDTLLRQAVSKLNAGGALFLEIGWQQGPATVNLAAESFPGANVDVISDFAGHDRIIRISDRRTP
jgi:release factor glutamine methyltransferase